MSEDRARRSDRLAKRKASESRNVFARLAGIYAASRTQGQRFLQKGGGLSIVEWRTVWDLAEAGPLSIRDLSYLQRADHSLLSRALPAMRKKGLVDMKRDPEDGRQMIVHLTDEGRARYEQAAPIMRARRQALRETFTEEEVDTMIGLLDRLEVFLRTPIDDLMKKEDA